MWVYVKIGCLILYYNINTDYYGQTYNLYRDENGNY